MFDGGDEMDKGLNHPWVNELDARERKVSCDEARAAMLQHFSDIATPGGTVIVQSEGEHWSYSLIGWCIMGIIVCCIALALVAIHD